MGIRETFREKPFATTFGLWGGIMVGVGVYLWRRQLPVQLKIIQARILAQAGLISGVLLMGAASYLSEDDHSKHSHATSSWKVRDFSSVPQPRATAAPAAAAAAAGAGAAAPAEAAQKPAQMQ